jgi:hypothetical protein
MSAGAIKWEFNGSSHLKRAIDWLKANWLLVSRVAISAVILFLLIRSAAIYYDDVSTAGKIGTVIFFDKIYYSEPVKLGINQKLEGAKSLVQVTILIIGALWALVIVKKDDRVLHRKDWPELLSFLFTNGMLIISLLFYIAYSNFLAQVLTTGNMRYLPPEKITIMDYTNKEINSLFENQIRICICGIISTALTFFSAYILNQPNEKKEAAPCNIDAS